MSTPPKSEYETRLALRLYDCKLVLSELMSSRRMFEARHILQCLPPRTPLDQRIVDLMKEVKAHDEKIDYYIREIQRLEYEVWGFCDK